MIQRMAKVEILGLKDIAVDAIDVIHDQGTLHIEDLTERIGKMENKRVSRMEMDEKYAEHEVKLRMLRDKVGQMIRELNPPEEHLDKAEIQKAYDDLYSEDVELMTARIEKSLEEIERETRVPVEKKNDLMVELSRLEKYSPIMAKVQPLTERVARMENMSSIALIIERKYKVILNYMN
jgi:vacuolar-type H+-ATPase subunit I/STV1